MKTKTCCHVPARKVAEVKRNAKRKASSPVLAVVSLLWSDAIFKEMAGSSKERASNRQTHTEKIKFEEGNRLVDGGIDV